MVLSAKARGWEVLGIEDATSGLVDLDYREDARADVDMNVVMTGRGQFVEVQGTAEQGTYDRDQLQALTDAAAAGIAEITRLQQKAVSEARRST